MKKKQSTKQKVSTEQLINASVAQQTTWHENRRVHARKFFKKLNVFAKPAQHKQSRIQHEDPSLQSTRQSRRAIVAAYWFPILCAVVVMLVAVWVMLSRIYSSPRVIVLQPDASVTDTTPVATNDNVVMTDESANISQIPTFDIVRIDKNGSLVVAGRWLPQQNLSVVVNNKIVATERTNNSGEFVYAPANALQPGNYTISLIGADNNVKSENKVFLYVSPKSYENSVSLLMTREGSKILQTPTRIYLDDMSIYTIDYLSNGRIVVTGDALPRMRISMLLDDKYVGGARVSDLHHFGLGANVGQLEPGRKYVLKVRMHDGAGTVLEEYVHTFVMPAPTGDSDTFYTVRRGDCLWVIARNFMRRGILFSIIADRNNIKNPDLIYPKQKLQIPVSNQ